MSIYLLLLDTHVQATVPGPAAGTTPMGPLGPLDQPWLLLVSVAMFAISFFLLHQAVAFQKWVTAKDEAAPNPWAGVGLAWAISLAMVVFSVAYWIFHHPPPVAGGEPNVFLWVISNRPSELATGPLLGSIVPAAIAIFKFVTAGFIMRGNAQELSPLSRSPSAALAGAVLAFISLSGSIAGLIRFFFWLKEP